MPGLFQSPVIITGSQASVAAGNISPLFVAPCDLEIIGLVAYVGTAPGAGDGVILNGSVAPTSQIGTGSQETPNPYNLWSTTATPNNRPSILGTSQTSFTVSQSTKVVQNSPYALNYPLPGPTGTSGYVTAQSTSQTTETPVTAPPQVTAFGISALVQPDNTYTDFNGFTLSAAILHAGDVVTWTVTAGGTNVSVGSAANLTFSVYCNKR
jgi:hypothetical protein